MHILRLKTILDPLKYALVIFQELPKSWLLLQVKGRVLTLAQRLERKRQPLT